MRLTVDCLKVSPSVTMRTLLTSLLGSSMVLTKNPPYIKKSLNYSNKKELRLNLTLYQMQIIFFQKMI